MSNEKIEAAFARYVFVEANSEPSSDTYPVAMEEMLLPAPSTKLDDFQMLSHKTGGFRPHEFSILCGATGVGKTTLLANISKSLITQQLPHFVASVETGRTDYVKRVISAMAEQDFNTGDPVSLESLREFNAKYQQHFIKPSLYLSRYESRFDVVKLMNDIAWHVKHHKIKVAMIDNLNFFLEVSKASDQLIEMDRVIHELIIFCKQIPVHVMMVMHPKKTDGGRVESEFDIKGSSTAVQEAHNVFLFNRPSDSMMQDGHISKFDRELKIVKMRRKGRAVGGSIIFNVTEGVSYREGAWCEFSRTNQPHRR